MSSHSHDPGHAENQPHGHDHGHDQGYDHRHDHGHGHGLWGWIARVFHLHGHVHGSAELAAEGSLLADPDGVRTVWLALAALGITSLLQLAIVAVSGSVALLADTMHNIGDALNSVPLLIAFYLARRQPTRRYTYGFGRAEDVAGIFIVLSIAVSAALIFWESFQKLLYPEPMTHLGWVAAAAVIGFSGNELVALLQIRKGRQIGSAALVADGQHARTDGLTSLAVLAAAAATWLGFPIVDPIIGLLIGVVILFITKDASLAMWHRLMDAIEPDLIAEAEAVIGKQPQVRELRRVRMRWVGHRLHGEVTIAVDPQVTTAEGHAVAEEARHALFHAIPHLYEVAVHVDPWSTNRNEHHEQTLHHEPVPAPIFD